MQGESVASDGESNQESKKCIVQDFDHGFF